jgi:hypothetical protein
MRSFERSNGITRTLPRGYFDRAESLNHLDCRDLRLKQMFRRANLIQPESRNIKISRKDARTLANMCSCLGRFSSLMARLTA